MEQKRGQFTFYESFAVALRRIRKLSDRCAAYDAIVNYALYGQEPELDKLPSPVAIAFDLIRPHLDTSRRKAEGGMKGSSVGENQKNTERSDKDKRKIGQRSDKDSANKRENKIENKNNTEYESEYENESEDERELRLWLEARSRETGLSIMGPRRRGGLNGF